MDSLDRTLFTELEPLVTAQGVDLVEVGVTPGGRRTVIQVVIHSEQGISHGDCRRVTRAVGGCLDESSSVTGAYVVEVSSPGVNRVIKDAREFELFRGDAVRVVLNEDVPDRQVTGQAAGTRTLEEEVAVVVLREDGEESVIPWSRVARARLIPDTPGRGGNGGKGS
ncbi:MAG: ribosome maturation factor RimP [Gemmatimonadota bacterium]|nr:MAG: ribosome maturation factor RimP [Gemmatimonadota bacterium]